MKRWRLPGFLLLALACAASWAAEQPEEWRAYHDEKCGYALQYPAGWEFVEARPRADDTTHRSGDLLLPGVLQQVTFREPEGKIWPAEFLVVVREQVEGRTLDEWADASFIDVYDESLVTGAADMVLAGQAARRFHVFGFDHTEIVEAFVHDGKVYPISYSGDNPNDPDLAMHGSIYERMRQSFQLLPPFAD